MSSDPRHAFTYALIAYGDCKTQLVALFTANDPCWVHRVDLDTGAVKLDRSRRLRDSDSVLYNFGSEPPDRARVAQVRKTLKLLVDSFKP